MKMVVCGAETLGPASPFEGTKMMRIAFCLAVALAATACARAPETYADASSDQGRIAHALERLRDGGGPVMVVAHRACWAGHGPENSLQAIDACIEMGVDMIEIDVALTADRTPVLMHDATLDRMTEGHGPVASLAAGNVLNLRLREGRGGADASLTQSRVPSLREALEHARGKILVNLDVKGEAYAETFALVDELGMGDQIVLKMRAGADDPNLRDAPFLGKTLFMPIIGECEPANLDKVCAPVLGQAVGGYEPFAPVAYEIVFQHRAYLEEGRDELEATDRRIWVNTLSPNHAAGLIDADAVDEPDAVWGEVLRLGADIIQTDYPAELIAYLSGKQLYTKRSAN